jgi:nitrate/nitrite transporter NarK
MKIRFWGIIAFNIAAMFVIVQATSFALTMALVMILLLTNILLAMVLRRIPLPRTDSFGGRTISMLHWASWTHYIPVLGGLICVFIGLFEFSWKPCVIGTVAIVIGVCRIWAHRRVRQTLRDRL